MEGGKEGTVEGVEDVTRSICVWCGGSGLDDWTRAAPAVTLQAPLGQTLNYAR